MSGAIESLLFRTSVDTAGWEAGLQAGNRLIDEMYAGIGEKYSQLKPPAPALSLGVAADGGHLDELAARMTSAMAGVAGQIRSTLAPLNSFSQDFARTFDQLGPTLERLAIRIDDAMRFPDFVKRVEGLQRWLTSRVGGAAKSAKAAMVAGAGDLDIGKVFGLDKGPSAFARAFDGVKATIARKFKQVEMTGVAGAGYTVEAINSTAKKGFGHFFENLPPSAAIFKRMADAAAILGRPGNKGKGSRTSFKNRQANAAGVASMIANYPPNANVAGSQAPSTAKWDALGRVIRAVRQAELWGTSLIHKAQATDVADINRVISAWLGMKKAASVVSTFGSVAKATWGSLSKLKTPKISIDPKQSTILRGIGSAAESVSSKMKALGVSVASALGLFGLAFKGVAFFKGGVAAASGLNETLNKTNAVLGVASGGVISFADTMANRFGLVKQDTLDVAAGFGGLYKGLGKQSGAALEQSTIDMTKLAADLSSFANMSFEEAGQALRTALSGNESDRLKQLGVVTTEAATEAYAYAHGIAKVGSELTNSQKVMARTGLIMTGLKDAQGDLENTSGSSANMFRKLGGSLTNFSAEIGTTLMPAIDRGLSALTGMVSGLSTAFGAGRALFDGFVAKLAIGFDFLGAVIGQPGAAFAVLKIKATEVFVNILEWIGVIPANFAILSDYIGKNWSKLLTDLAINTLTACENIVSNFSKISAAIGRFMANPMGGFPTIDWTPLTQGFLQTADKLPALIRPALTDLSKEIAAAGKPIWDDFEKRRAEALKPATAMNAAKGDALAGVDKAEPEKKKKPKEEKQFAEVAEFGSKEAYSSTISAMYGLPKKANAELEKNGREQLAVQRRIADGIDRQNRQQPPKIKVKEIQ